MLQKYTTNVLRGRSSWLYMRHCHLMAVGVIPGLLLQYRDWNCPVLTRLVRVQKRLRDIVADELLSTLQPLSMRRNAGRLSLLYRYFYDDLPSLVLKLYGRDQLCNLHKDESFSFPLYSN